MQNVELTKKEREENYKVLNEEMTKRQAEGKGLIAYSVLINTH